MTGLRKFVGSSAPLDAATYDYALHLCPSDLAWEFLRRNPDYQRDYRIKHRGAGRCRRLKSGPFMVRVHRGPGHSAKWGNYSFCRFDIAGGGPQAAVCWTIGTKAPILEVRAGRSGLPDRRDVELVHHAAISHVVIGPDRVERIVLRDAMAAVTLHARNAHLPEWCRCADLSNCRDTRSTCCWPTVRLGVKRVTTSNTWGTAAAACALHVLEGKRVLFVPPLPRHRACRAAGSAAGTSGQYRWYAQCRMVGRVPGRIGHGSG